jgi:AGZA family xanthine/uracil permease-like MFS transporter
MMIGLMLFENAGKVNWSNMKEALPVFLMTVFIHFTYSILNGVIVGFVIFLLFIIIDWFSKNNIFIRWLVVLFKFPR